MAKARDNRITRTKVNELLIKVNTKLSMLSELVGTPSMFYTYIRGGWFLAGNDLIRARDNNDTYTIFVGHYSPTTLEGCYHDVSTNTAQRPFIRDLTLRQLAMFLKGVDEAISHMDGTIGDTVHDLRRQASNSNSYLKSYFKAKKRGDIAAKIINHIAKNHPEVDLVEIVRGL